MQAIGPVLTPVDPELRIARVGFGLLALFRVGFCDEQGFVVRNETVYRYFAFVREVDTDFCEYVVVTRFPGPGS